MPRDIKSNKSTDNEAVTGTSPRDPDASFSVHEFYYNKLDQVRHDYHDLRAKQNILEGKLIDSEEKIKNQEDEIQGLRDQLREAMAKIVSIESWKNEKEASDITLKNENKKLKEDNELSQQAIDYMEMSQRRPYLVINNLPEEASKKDEELFMDLARNKLELGDSININDIASVSRLKGNYRNAVNRTSTSKPNAMLMKFQNEKERNLIFSNKKKLKGSGKVINEFLTPRRSALLKECYDTIPGTFSERSIWTHNGRILVRKNGSDNTTYEIKCTDNIKTFLAKHNLTARGASSDERQV